ncbi:hypothetical protein VPH35_009864 [Triticum aestivum]
MYAAGYIFWQTDVPGLLLLDSSTMKFSEHPVPSEINSAHCAIGELQDGEGCLVCLQGRGVNVRLEVWVLEEEEANICWILKQNVLLRQICEKSRVCHVDKVTNGLAMISGYDVSYAIDIQSMTCLAKFNSGRDAHPYQLSWPHAVKAAATSVVSRSLGANLPNQESAQIPGNNNDGREGKVHNSRTPLSSEELSQDMHGGSARIQPMETNPGHDELTLKKAGVFPSVSCDGAILEDKSETGSLPKINTEDTEMLEQQNSDKAHLEVSCDEVSEVLYRDNNTLEKSTICGGKVPAESHRSDFALLHNESLEARNNTSAFLGTKQFAKQQNGQSTGKQQITANSEDNLNEKPFECEACSKKFPRKVNLAGHVERLHGSMGTPFTCGFIGCSEEFPSKHVKKEHEKSKAHVELSTGKIKCLFKDCTQTFTMVGFAISHSFFLSLIVCL